MRGKKASVLLLAAAAFATTSSSAIAVDTTYTVTDLGPTTFTGFVRGLNNKGQVLVNRTFNGVDQTHLYSNGVFTPVRQLAAVNAAVDARDINDGGDIVGFYGDTGFLLKSGGTRVDLPDFGGDRTIPTAVNNQGQVVGQSQTSTTFQTNFVRHAFSFRDANANNVVDSGEMVDLGAFVENGESFADDVNEAGVIAGNADFERANGHQDLYRWTNLAGQNLKVGDGGHEEAQAINEAGVIVGTWTPLSTSTRRGFIYRPATGFADLGFVGFNTRVGANDINESGLVVGETEDVGFIWDSNAGGAVQDLSDLLDPASSQWTIEAAFHINDLGQIVARGRLGTSDYHSVLLTPVPEPVGTSLCGGAGILLATRRRRARSCL